MADSEDKAAHVMLRERMLKVLYGFGAIVAGIASILLFNFAPELFLVVNVGYMFVFIILTMYSMLRIRKQLENDTTIQGTNNRRWTIAIEFMSYFAIFESFFVFLIVMHMFSNAVKYKRWYNPPGSGGGGGGGGGSSSYKK